MSDCDVNKTWKTKGRFRRYDFVACGKVTTGVRHELLRVNQTYNSLTTVVYVKKNCSKVLKHVLKRRDNRSRNLYNMRILEQISTE